MKISERLGSWNSESWFDPSLKLNPLRRSYEPVEKDLSCDIAVVNLRTMQAASGRPAPSEEATLIVHRQGFNGCYKPVGMTCGTNGGKVCFKPYINTTPLEIYFMHGFQSGHVVRKM